MINTLKSSRCIVVARLIDRYSGRCAAMDYGLISHLSSCSPSSEGRIVSTPKTG